MINDRARRGVRPIPMDIIRGWTEGLITEPGVQRDVRQYVATTPKDCLIEEAEGLRTFDKPALVIWPTDDRTMPRSHGARLAHLRPPGRLIELDDCSVLMPLDQAIVSPMRSGPSPPASDHAIVCVPGEPKLARPGWRWHVSLEP